MLVYANRTISSLLRRNNPRGIQSKGLLIKYLLNVNERGEESGFRGEESGFRDLFVEEHVLRPLKLQSICCAINHPRCVSITKSV